MDEGCARLPVRLAVLVCLRPLTPGNEVTVELLHLLIQHERPEVAPPLLHPREHVWRGHLPHRHFVAVRAHEHRKGEVVEGGRATGHDKRIVEPAQQQEMTEGERRQPLTKDRERLRQRGSEVVTFHESFIGL